MSAKTFPATPVPFDEITRQAERLIRDFLQQEKDCAARGDDEGARARSNWAFGVYMQWQASAPRGMLIPRNNALEALIFPEDVL